MNPGTEEGGFQFSHIKGPGGQGWGVRLRAGGSKETVPFCFFLVGVSHI